MSPFLPNQRNITIDARSTGGLENSMVGNTFHSQHIKIETSIQTKLGKASVSKNRIDFCALTW